MRTLSMAFLVSCVLTAFVSGCEDRKGVVANPQATAPEKAQQPVIKDKRDLERLLLPGMGTNQIILALGQPRWIENVSNGEQVWEHSVPPFPGNSDTQWNYTTYVIGVTVGITNGQLAYWGCVSAGVPRGQAVRREDVHSSAGGQSDAVDLKFFIVSKDPIPDGRFIDTERFPKLGFIPLAPTLAISKVREVSLEERTQSDSKNQTSIVWSFGVSVASEDASRLKTVTAEKLGERFLVMLGNEPISAVTLVLPLETGSFEIEVQDKSLMELAKDGFAKMERQNQ